MMPVDQNSLLQAVSTIARNQNVTITVRESAKAGAIAGGSCFIGAVMGGPVGLAIGGLVGTSLAYMRSGNIKPLWRILIEDLTPVQQAQLVQQLQLAFRDVGVQDIALLAALILQTSSLQETAIRVTMDYVSGQLK